MTDSYFRHFQEEARGNRRSLGYTFLEHSLAAG